jgi:hypothetical protein
MSPIKRLALVALLAGLVSACSVDTTVEVVVREDGSGVVRVEVVADAEAVRAVEAGGATIDAAVRLTDLEDGGWRVGTWERAEDGSASLLLTHPFDNVAEVAGIFEQASGAGGPLHDVQASRERGLLATEYTVRGEADLANVETGVAGDQELVESLAAQGVDVTVIDQQLLASLQSSFSLELVVKLPGEQPVTITATPGEVTPIDVSASVRDTQRVIFLIAAAGFALLAVVMWIRGGRRRRRRGRGRGRPSPPRAPAAPPARARARPPQPRGPAPRGPAPRGPAPRGPAPRPQQVAPRPPPRRAPRPPGGQPDWRP